MKKNLKEQVRTQPTKGFTDFAKTQFGAGSGISGTIDKETKKKWLSRAITDGCFDTLDLDITNDTPQEKDGNIVIFAKGKSSNEDWLITYEPDANQKNERGLQMLGKIVKTKNPNEFVLWFCRTLQSEISNESAQKPEEQAPKTDQDKTEDQKEEQITTTEPTTMVVSPTLKQALNAAKNQPLQEIKLKDCVDAINLFFKYSKNAPEADLGDFHETVKKSVLKCSRQENMKKLNKRFKKDLNAKLETISNYSRTHPHLSKYKIENLPQIAEHQNLNNMIKNVLIETKLQKENRIILEQLCENRMKTVIENFSDFEKFSRVKKVRYGFRFLREASELMEMGVLSENLADVFQSLYGKSMEGVIGSISEPLMNSLLTKIGLDDNLKSKVLNNIKNKGSEIILNMNDCKLLSLFISKSISEELTIKIDTENIVKSDLVNASLVDTLKNPAFIENLNMKLENLVCGLYDKFTENAKNLVVRMTSL